MAFVVSAAAGIRDRRGSLRWGLLPTDPRTRGRSAASMFPAPGGGLPSAPPSIGSSPWLSGLRLSQVPPSTDGQIGGVRQSGQRATIGGNP